VLGVLVSATRQENKVECMGQEGREKKSSFTYDMMSYVQNLQELKTKTKQNSE
jgi:hypothetical protein